jgi:GDP-L-fucose synthase
MIKLLLLGGEGYLGNIFYKKYNTKINIINPSRKELNLLFKKSIQKFFENKKHQEFDIILNLSVYQLTGEHLVKNAKRVTIINQNLNKNILYLWKRYLPQSKLISMGASCAYSLYRKELSYTNGKLFEGTKMFALPKRFLAKKCEYLSRKFKMKFLILVPGTLIGPGEQLNLKKMHFFNGILFRAAKYKKKKTKTFKFLMNQNVLRELSSVENVVDQIYKNIKNNKKGILNLKVDYKISLKQLYDLIENRLGFKNIKNSCQTTFNASKNKTYKVSVKEDLTEEKFITSRKFLYLFDTTFNYFLKKIHNKPQNKTLN